MLRIRRLAAVVGALGLASALVAGPASADTPEVFAGSAAARALDLKIVNHTNPQLNAQATLGLTTANAASDLTAKATAVGELLADVTKLKKEAAADRSDPAPDQDSGCAKVIDPLPLFNLGIACGKATASAVNNLPVATSEASVAGLTVDGENALSTLKLDGVPGQLGDALAGALDEICTRLNNNAQACSATDTLKTVVTEVLRTRLLEVEVGPAKSSVVTEAATVTSSASSAAVVIRLLPLPDAADLVSTEPILTIEVSSAKATVVYDRAEGAVTAAKADPAIVRVKFNKAITDELGLPTDGLAIGPDDLPVSLLELTPLGTDITVADARVENVDGVHKAVAQGVQIRLLTALGESAAGKKDGGIVLNLAYAEAVGGGKPATTTPAPGPDPDEAPRGELPKTGGPGPVLPVVGAGVLALAVITRRATARAH